MVMIMNSLRSMILNRALPVGSSMVPHWICAWYTKRRGKYSNPANQLTTPMM
jgi:hypothetical protein